MNFQVLTLFTICGVVHSSGVHLSAPIADAPVVTASSSQYFERTFNRLVAPPVYLEPSVRPQQFVPVQPVQPVAVQPVTHLRPVQLQPVPSFQSVIPVQPVQPTQPSQPAQPPPVEPNVAIAIATANAAAPVATILLPPYPFGFPPTFGFIPQEQPREGEDRTKEETTTQNPTTQVDVKTTREPEATTQVPNGSDNNGVQASPSNQDESQVNFRQYLSPSPLPSNQNVNFKQYATPSPLPSNQDVNLRQYWSPNPQFQRPQYQQPLALPHHHHHHHQPHTHIHVHPKKLKTLVEVQRVPLAYIAPPPLPYFQKSHQAFKVVKHIYSFLPSKAKLIIRPVLKTRSIQVNAGYKVPSSEYRAPAPLPLRSVAPRSQNERPTKEIEQTTLRSFPIPNTKPPRL